MNISLYTVCLLSSFIVYPKILDFIYHVVTNIDDKNVYFFIPEDNRYREVN